MSEILRAALFAVGAMTFLAICSAAVDWISGGKPPRNVEAGERGRR